MKAEILNIAKNLENSNLTINDARTLLLGLFGVSEHAALHQPPVVSGSLPSDEFLSKHLYKTDALLKFGITEMIHKKDLSRTELIGVLEYISNLR